ncbi:MAG TPA: helix-turn-helix transcriptional regulator [Thiolinea sp.]|nr:helix-turn-helix transcriptional regulator [Thiolinea sp.]
MEKNDLKLSARQLFARNIRLARKDLGMSQEAMAEACGLHRTYVGDVERGERNISIDNMEAMAKAVKKSLAELVCCTSKFCKD